MDIIYFRRRYVCDFHKEQRSVAILKNIIEKLLAFRCFL